MSASVGAAPVIEIRGVSAGYTESSWSPAPRRRIVVKDISLTLCGGEIVAICGANGAGKTTLLRGVVDPKSRFAGEVICNGESLPSGSIAYVPQAAALSLAPWRDIESEIALGLRLRGFSRKTAASIVAERCGRFGSALPMHRRVAELSAGQKVRVAILRAMVLPEARLAVFDEPFENLSVDGREAVLTLIRRAANQGVAVLLTSHRAEDLRALHARQFKLVGTPVTRLEPLSDGTEEKKSPRPPSAVSSGGNGSGDLLESTPAERTSGGFKRILESFLVGTAGLLMGMLIWAWIAWFLSHPGLLPGPLSVISEMVHVLQTPGRAHHLVATLLRAGVCWVLAAAIAIPVGALLGYDLRVFRLVSPWLSIGRCVPVFALAGTAIGLFPNMPETQRLFLIFLALFLIGLQIVSLGAALAPRARMDIARIFGAGFWFRFRRVLLPECRGSILSALETTLPIAVIVTMVVEITLLPRIGLGQLVFNHIGDADSSAMYAYLLLPALAVALTMWVLRSVAQAQRYE